MLAIRLQRHGRKGQPMYRLVVQEAQRHPSSGRVVAYVGTYNPHTKDTVIKKEDAEKYLGNGAQPTPRVAALLEANGVTMPSWVAKTNSAKQKSVRNPDKLRKNQPKEEPEVAEAEVAEPVEG